MLSARGFGRSTRRGTIGIVGEEPHPPYKRPPLTQGPLDRRRRGEDLAEDRREGRRRCTSAAASSRSTSPPGACRTTPGDEYGYEKLVLATGGTPRRLGGDDADVIYFRDLDDYRRTRALSDEGARFAVIGGGFIGSEIAAALCTAERDVTIVVPEPGISWRNFPPDLSASVTEEYRQRGVSVWTDSLRRERPA